MVDTHLIGVKIGPVKLSIATGQCGTQKLQRKTASAIHLLRADGPRLGQRPYLFAVVRLASGGIAQSRSGWLATLFPSYPRGPGAPRQAELNQNLPGTPGLRAPVDS